jgi:hypothetical protein
VGSMEKFSMEASAEEEKKDEESMKSPTTRPALRSSSGGSGPKLTRSGSDRPNSSLAFTPRTNHSLESISVQDMVSWIQVNKSVLHPSTDLYLPLSALGSKQQAPKHCCDG